MASFQDKFADSAVGRYFKIRERNTTLGKELIGGFVTFLTSCYILAANSNILGDSGGPCITNGACPKGPGSLGDPNCQSCLQEFKINVISATAAACIISHFLMGVAANMPLAICPAMGINAYFTYTVVGFMGTGRITYVQALGAVFVEGWIFILVSVLGVRTKLVEYLPKSIMYATSAGIGLFLCFLGLQNSEGLGVVTYQSATLVTLGGCPPEYRNYQYSWDDSSIGSACIVNSTGGADINPNTWVPSGTFSCDSAGVMRSATMWLGISGGMLMAFLLAKGVRGAMMAGIAFITFISWIKTDGNKATYLGDTSYYLGGEQRWNYFRKVATVPDTSLIAGKLSFSGFSDGDLWLALFTFLYVDFLDATGTLFSMANFMATTIPGFVDEKTKRFDRQTITYCVDGVSIVVGSLLGISPLTVYIESAAGIKEGARTGVAALVIMFCFFIALWFSPLIAAIPPYAVGPALILVGAMMMLNCTKIDWSNVADAVPAFLTIAVMPLTYSIAYGLLAGIFSWIWLNGMLFIWNFVEYKLFPSRRPADSEGENAWQTVRKMTFVVRNNAEFDAKEDISQGKPAGSPKE